MEKDKKPTISRRAFLHGAIAVSEVLLQDKFPDVTEFPNLAVKSIHLAELYIKEKTTNLSKAAEVIDQEKIELVEKIREYYAKCGLNGLPDSTNIALENKNTTWKREPRFMKNRLPSSLRSYGELFLHQANTLFTPVTAMYLIRGIGFNPSSSGENLWYPSNQEFMLSPSVRGVYWLEPNSFGWTVFDLNSHEDGHIIDTNYLAAFYPQKTSLQIERAKWRMLAQSPKVTGAITENNPNWNLNYSLPRDFGAEVAKSYILGGNNLRLDETERKVVDEVVQKLAHDLGYSAQKLRFNKQHSLLFGRELMPHIRNGSLFTTGVFQKVYAEKLQESFIEVFAELNRAILVNPNLVNLNGEILEGGQQIYSTLRNDTVSLEQLRRLLQQVPDEIKRMWEEEQEALDQQVEQPKLVTLVESMPNIDLLAQEVEVSFQGLLEGGVSRLPKIALDQDERDLFYRCFEGFHLICQKHLELSNSDPNLSRTMFDPPELHFWEIEKVDEAVNPDFMRSILRKVINRNVAVELEEEERAKLKKYGDVMEKYISSDAFIT